MARISPKPADSARIVLFDGDCNLCNGAVQFIIARDERGLFQFASLQSAFGRQVAAEQGLAAADAGEATMVLLDGERVFTRAEAALQIAQQLGNSVWQRRLWSSLTILGRCVPRVLRNAVYGWVARHRRQLWGEQTACWVPSPELRKRFVE